MAERCLLYYITDRTQFCGDESSRRRRLLEKIAEAARCRVDFIQLREKDLASRELELLAAEAVRLIRESSPQTRDSKLEAPRLLINSRSDVALAVAADGIHLRSNDISPRDARDIQITAMTRNAKLGTRNWAIAVSCHTAEEVRKAAEDGADFTVFAPVFAKKDSPETRPTGLEALGHASQHKVPVLALGGVTVENARSCMEAGAAGIAGIRLFQENDIAGVVRGVRNR